MERQESYFSELKQTLREYVSDKLLLLKLQAFKELIRIGAAIAVLALCVFLSFYVLIFLGLTLGYLLIPIVNSIIAAFAFVLLFYILLIFLIVMLRKKILNRWVSKKIIHLILSNHINIKEDVRTD